MGEGEACIANIQSTKLKLYKIISRFEIYGLNFYSYLKKKKLLPIHRIFHVCMKILKCVVSTYQAGIKHN